MDRPPPTSPPWYLGTDETDICALGPKGESIMVASTNVTTQQSYDQRCADAARIVKQTNAAETLRLACIALNKAREARMKAGYGNMSAKRHEAARVLRDAENAVTAAAFALTNVIEEV